MSDNRTVNIHGKEYETVASRVQRFRKEHGDKYGILTDAIQRTEDVVVVKATIVRYGQAMNTGDGGQYTDSAVIATGYAEEQRASSQINRTSALENAETSAIGRALANFGMAGTEYASADEVAQAIGQRSTPPPTPTRPADPIASTAKISMMLGSAKFASGKDDREEIIKFFTDETGKKPTEVHESEVAGILKHFKDLSVGDDEVAA